MENFRDEKSTVQFTTNHHDPTTNPPPRNHSFTHVFAKTPCKNAKNHLKEKIRINSLIGVAGVFGDELRGEFEVVPIACGDEVTEDRVRLQRLGLEFRVELASQEERMCRYFNDFHVGGVRRRAGDPQTPAREDSLILPVELIAMTVALAYLYGTISLSGE
jgi:hypothetical protein